MGDFNPANGLVRFGWESTAGHPPPVADLDKYHKIISEDLSNEAEIIQPQSIDSGAQTPRGLPSKLGTNGNIATEVEAEGMVYYVAAAQKNASVTNPASGVYVHKLAPSESAIAMPSTFANEAYRDDDNPQLFKGGRVGSLEFALSPRGLLTCTINNVYARSDYWKDAAATVDPTPNAALPFLQGFPNLNNWLEAATADGDIYIEVDSVAGLPDTFDVLVKIGAASSYGATVSTITVGEPSPLFDSNGGARIGTRAMEVEFYIADGTDVQVGDTWRIDRERDVWTPSFPDIPFFNEIYASIFLGADTGNLEEFRIREFGMTVTPPVQSIFNIGGRFADQVRNRGRRTVELTLAREYLDTTLRKRLESGEPFAFRLDAYTGEEFETGHEHEFSIISPLCIAGGRTPSVQGQDQMDENVTATAHPDATNGEGFVDDVTFLVKNSIADLSA